LPASRLILSCLTCCLTLATGTAHADDAALAGWRVIPALLQPGEPGLSQQPPVRLLVDTEGGNSIAVIQIGYAGPAGNYVMAPLGPNGYVALSVGNIGGGKVAVLYPESNDAFRAVFQKIIQGIEERTGNKVLSYQVGNTINQPALLAELRQQGVRVVVGLGRQGHKAATSMDGSMEVVVGSVLAVPESEAQSMAVHTLAPDPALLFKRLKQFQPNTRRIHVVYDPRQNGWLIRLARQAARNLGIELNAVEAGSVAQALRAYQSLIANADKRLDALWLPQDSTTVDDSTLLPLLLEDIWTKNLLMFSSNFAHVKRGALFSLYPSSLEMGRTLGDSVASALGGRGSSHGVQPLTDVMIAVNMRTATHLGIDLTQQRSSFHTVLPVEE